LKSKLLVMIIVVLGRAGASVIAARPESTNPEDRINKLESVTSSIEKSVQLWVNEKKELNDRILAIENEQNVTTVQIRQLDKQYTNLLSLTNYAYVVLGIIVTFVGVLAGIGLMKYEKRLEAALSVVKKDVELIKNRGDRLHRQSKRSFLDFKKKSDRLLENIIETYTQLAQAHAAASATSNEAVEEINQAARAMVLIISSAEDQVKAGLDILFSMAPAIGDESWKKSLRSCREKWPNNSEIVARIDEIHDLLEERVVSSLQSS